MKQYFVRALLGFMVLIGCCHYANANVCFLPDAENCDNAEMVSVSPKKSEPCLSLINNGYTQGHLTNAKCSYCQGKEYCKCGSGLHKSGLECVCDGEKVLKNGVCVGCGEGQVLNEQGNCVCSDDKKELNTDGQCVCKSIYMPDNNGNCSSCTFTDKFADAPSRGYACDSCERDGNIYYGNCKCLKLDNKIAGQTVGCELIGTDGKKYCKDCSNEDDPDNPCYGKYHCLGGRNPGNPTCYWGNVAYYDACLVEETCGRHYKNIGNLKYVSLYYPNGGCGSDNKYYRTGEIDCQTVDLKTYYWCADGCYKRGTDNMGNLTPLSKAESELGVTLNQCKEGTGKFAQVCAKTYYENCSSGTKFVECSYNYTEDSKYPDKHCKPTETFVKKCKDSNGTIWGECGEE